MEQQLYDSRILFWEIFLQIISPLLPSFLFAVFHIRVLLTRISLVSKSRSVISNASNSLIRNADANSVLQMTLKRLLLLYWQAFKVRQPVFQVVIMKYHDTLFVDFGFGGILIVLAGLVVSPQFVIPKSKISLTL